MRKLHAVPKISCDSADCSAAAHLCSSFCPLLLICAACCSFVEEEQASHGSINACHSRLIRPAHFVSLCCLNLHAMEITRADLIS